MTRSTRLRHVLGPVLGLAGVALALTATATASAQTSAAPSGPAAAPTTGSTTAAPTGGTTAAPTGGTTAPATTAAAEDEEAKKKAAATAAPTSAAADPKSPDSTAATGNTSGSTTVTFGANPKKDEPTAAAKAEEPAPAPNPFRGSLLIFDQSMTVNTLRKDAQLSYQPVYEWRISPRVTYNINKTLRVTLRQDVFKEWTNSTESTYRNEWRYTDTWLSLAQRLPLDKISKNLSGAVGLQLRPGISKESRIAGQYFAGGPLLSVSYNIPLGGEKAKAFKALHLSSAVIYQHALSRCNTPCASESSDFSQARMNADNQPVNDRQVRSLSMVGNQLVYTANVGFDIVEHVDFSASMIWISQWARDTSTATFNGRDLPRSDDDTRLRQFSWFFTQVSWGAMPEFDVALGYWNLNATVHPEGYYRNPFWSPEARVFLDVIVHLDAVYDKLFGGGGKKGGGAGGASRVL